MTPTKPNSTVQRVLAVIQEDPGVNLGHIREHQNDLTPEQVRNSLNYLRRSKQIVNRGKHAKGASWYPAE